MVPDCFGSKEMKFKIGTKVRTTKDAGSNDWAYSRNPQWGKEGMIIKHSNSHGEIYLVKHDNNLEQWYEEKELEFLNL